ncbi:MAG: hypothetical protein M1818_005917 [Claussenomyces sp. TS43310]|nr:MAG: hypothetical protein M1818_005917 [Claussenomyces sp. TS43310]
MGIPGPGQSLEPGKSTFSDDLLSIELCGPEKQNLSVIDIPGIFRSPTQGVTTNGDMLRVRKMVDRQIREERTIILAVIPSNTDVATQEILEIAKKVDPAGVRTLGVLTKPDLVDRGGEENIMSLVEGKRNPLRLGYCMVRNRGQSELGVDSAERDRTEKNFFDTEPWSRLDKDRVGTSALQNRLQDILVDITRREFPKVQAQIVHDLSDCRRRLADLGADRQSTDQQRRYLLEMSKKFQDITNFALDAYYSRDSIFNDNPALRLATLSVERNGEFSDQVDKLGHMIQFEADQGMSSDVHSQISPTQSEIGSIRAESPISCTGLTKLDESSYQELSDLVQQDWDIPEPIEDGIIEWIGQEYRKARGFGLATIGPSILPTIWQEQSKKWEGLTMNYLADMIFYVHDFICQVLAHVCPDERIRSSLWSLLQELLLERYQRAVEHVKFIIEVERSGTPLTTNHYFNDNLQKYRSRRLTTILEKNAENSYNRNGAPGGRVLTLQQVQESLAMDNTEHTIQEIHDILASYYKVARKRFVDTVCMQGSDFHLLTGHVSPLRIFGNAFVTELSAAQLDSIAGEDLSTKQLRKSLTNEIIALEKGKKLLRA